MSGEAIEEYVAVLSAPGALTAALNWYRAMSSDTRVDPVGVPTTYVWSDGDAAIGRTAAEACANYVTGDYRFLELPGITHWIPEQAPEAARHRHPRPHRLDVASDHVAAGDTSEDRCAATRALANAGITSLRQVAEHSRAELAALHGMGPKALGILEASLAESGLGFR